MHFTEDTAWQWGASGFSRPELGHNGWKHVPYLSGEQSASGRFPDLMLSYFFVP
jgi:hypothetical protein